MGMAAVKDQCTFNEEMGMFMVTSGTHLEKDILMFFHASWGSKPGPYFPGPQPVSIERKHFPFLKNGHYLVCEKSDGVRYCMVCKTYGKEKVVCLINRSLQILLVRIEISKNVLQGTVMDGELLEDKRFIVYDCVMFAGQDTKAISFAHRLKYVERFVSGIIKMKTDTIKVKTKVFYPLRDILRYQNEVLVNVDYKTDGFVFTPINAPVKIGTHNLMFKWKPQYKNTIDFQFKSKDDKTWAMYIQERGRLIYESEIAKDSVKIEEEIKEDSIVECEYMGTYWSPILIRTDKTYPNGRKTFYNTLNNIREDIQVYEFHELFSST